MPFPRQGIIAALWTPTDADGRLLDHALRTNINFMRARGVHGLLTLGTTGEFLQLDLSQRKNLVAKVVEFAEGLPVMVNISDIRPAAAAELGRFARQIGAASVAILPPHYYPVTQEDMLEHFLRAGEAASLPTLLYNFPERTGNRIEIATVAAFADRLPMAGVKQSGDEFAYHTPLVRLGREKGFPVFTGADTRLTEAMSLGVAGCIGGLVNATPDLLVEVYSAVHDGVPGRAAESARRTSELGDCVRRVPFPLNMAAVMEARGLTVGQPKAAVSPKTAEDYRQLVNTVRTLFGTWGLA